MTGSVAIRPTHGFAPTPPAAPGALASIIAVRGVAKRFPVRRSLREIVRAPLAAPAFTALQDIHLDVMPGELFGLLGPNGAGKSTLFRILSTILLPDAGEVRVDGHDVVADAAAVRRRLVPASLEDRSLFWRLSAFDNLRVYGTLHDLPAREARRRAAELLEVVGLEDAGTKLVASFSSGMRQRLMIARALLARPAILLLDEPTRSLDPLSARAFRAFLRDVVVAQQGCTVLLATHSADEAFGLADRVAVLHRGRILATGRTEALASGIADDTYIISTRTPAHPVLRGLERRGLTGPARIRDTDPDGWTRVEFSIPGNADAAAAVLDALGAAGMALARFERAAPSLADLLERIVARNAREGGHA